jgi:Tfp pilus assembly protein FimT
VSRRAGRKLTPVEMMVVLAILGILLSIAAPAIQRAGHGGRRTRHGGTTTTASRPNEGQYNRIEAPQTAKQGRRGPAPAGRSGAWWVVQVAIVVVIIRAIASRRRRENAALPKKTRRKHPPEDES